MFKLILFVSCVGIHVLQNSSGLWRVSLFIRKFTLFSVDTSRTSLCHASTSKKTPLHKVIPALQDKHTFMPNCCTHNDCQQCGCKLMLQVERSDLYPPRSSVILRSSFTIPLNLTNQQTLSLESCACYSRVAGQIVSWWPHGSQQKAIAASSDLKELIARKRCMTGAWRNVDQSLEQSTLRCTQCHMEFRMQDHVATWFRVCRFGSRQGPCWLFSKTPGQTEFGGVVWLLLREPWAFHTY